MKIAFVICRMCKGCRESLNALLKDFRDFSSRLYGIKQELNIMV